MQEPARRERPFVVLIIFVTLNSNFLRSHLSRLFCFLLGRVEAIRGCSIDGVGTRSIVSTRAGWKSCVEDSLLVLI